MPLHEAHAELAVEPIDNGQSRVTWSMDYRVKIRCFWLVIGPAHDENNDGQDLGR